jgi:hypothetical protein
MSSKHTFYYTLHAIITCIYTSLSPPTRLALALRTGMRAHQEPTTSIATSAECLPSRLAEAASEISASLCHWQKKCSKECATSMDNAMLLEEVLPGARTRLGRVTRRSKIRAAYVCSALRASARSGLRSIIEGSMPRKMLHGSSEYTSRKWSSCLRCSQVSCSPIPLGVMSGKHTWIARTSAHYPTSTLTVFTI